MQDRRPGRGSTARLQPRHEKEFLHVSNEETTNTEEPRAQALAMRAGGRKKAAAKKGGRKKAAPKKAGRKAAPKKKAAGRKKSGGRKKAAAAAAPTAESMPSTSDSMC